MMQQVDLFSAIAVASNVADSEPETVKNEAVAASWGNAGESWQKLALASLRAICESKRTFTADDLDSLMQKAREPRAIGGLLKQGQKKGWCRATGNYEPSNLPRRHSRPVMIWESRLSQP